MNAVGRTKSVALVMTFIATTGSVGCAYSPVKVVGGGIALVGFGIVLVGGAEFADNQCFNGDCSYRNPNADRLLLEGVITLLVGVGVAALDGHGHDGSQATEAELANANLAANEARAHRQREVEAAGRAAAAHEPEESKTTSEYWCASSGDGSCWTDEERCIAAGGGCLRLDEAWCAQFRDANGAKRSSCSSTRAACQLLLGLPRNRDGSNFGECVIHRAVPVHEAPPAAVAPAVASEPAAVTPVPPRDTP